MKWIIRQIYEGDYGCEERMPGEPLIVIVELENEEGRTFEIEAADQWLLSQGLEEGDEWPDDLEEEDDFESKAMRQLEWMDNYLEAVEEIDIE